MRTIIRAIDRFFFAEVSASGFGLMRIAWAATALAFLLGGAPDVIRYYSEIGILPADLGHLVFRSEHRFTLLTSITTPGAVVALWSITVVSLLCMMLGIWPRLMTIASVLLLFSFQERNLQPLGGGDTVLRTVGFLLMISPEVSAFSVDRAEKQWASWQSTGNFLQPLRTHIWPYRLLLWQMIIIYLTSLWDKTQGTMWTDGTVVAVVLHHTHFARWPKEFMDSIIWVSPFACLYTLVFEGAWGLLLIPQKVWSKRPQWMRRFSLKRWIICGGLVFHWGIFLFMDVGSFPCAMTTAYIGLLLDDDFAMFTRKLNKHWKGKIAVLYDGRCHLCQRSIFTVQLLDHLHRMRIVNFRDKTQKNTYAKDLSEEDLDKAMHIILPDGTTYKGFDAFRILTWHLPALRAFTPLLWIPGVAPIGRRVYTRIANTRNACSTGACAMK